MAPDAFGPVTMPALIGRDLTDERELSLTTAPVHILVQDVPGRTCYTAVIDAKLDRRGLMDLLYTLAPYKAHGPDRFSRVLDNWALLERAKTSPASENLMLEHARSLKFSWQEFVRHRHVFVEVLQDTSGERSVTPLIAWSRDADGKRRWELQTPPGDVLARVEILRQDGTIGDLDTLVGLVTVPYYVPELRKNWRAWMPLVKGGKSNYIGPASVPVVALMHRRALLNSPLIERAEAYVASAVT